MTVLRGLSATLVAGVRLFMVELVVVGAFTAAALGVAAIVLMLR